MNIDITHIQYCLGEDDITGSFYAREDSDCIRYWLEDMCILEAVRTGEYTNGVWQEALWKVTCSDVFAYTDQELDMRVTKIGVEELLHECVENRGGKVEFLCEI